MPYKAAARVLRGPPTSVLARSEGLEAIPGIPMHSSTPRRHSNSAGDRAVDEESVHSIRHHANRVILSNRGGA